MDGALSGDNTINIADADVSVEQTKITDVFFSSKVNAKKSESNTLKLCSFIVKDMQPISIIEGSGFKEMLAHFAPNYKIPARGTITSRVDLLYKQQKSEVLNKLNNCKILSLTTDCWTSRATESYITITAHGITEMFQTFNSTLVTKEMVDSHTADNLKSVIEEVVDEWGLNGKVIATTHDNAKNITNAAVKSDIMGYSIPCFAHSLQLCINKGLQLEKPALLIKKCSNIVTFFHQSSKANSALRSVQETLNVQQHRLIQHVKTRWNSCFYMLSRLLEQKLCIQAVLNDRNVVSHAKALELEVITGDYAIIEEIVSILQPFEIATTYLSSSKFPTLSVVAPLVSSLVDNFLKTVSKESSEAANLKSEIRVQLLSRFAFVFSGKKEVQLIATYLDPRYKNLKGCATSSKIKIEQWLREECHKNYVPVATLTTTKSATSFLFPDEDIDTTINEIDNYSKESVISKDSCPLEWWKRNAYRYPELCKFARSYLCIPATSTPSERVFSTAGNIVSAKRSCLLPENVNKLVFLAQNKNV